LPREGNRQNRYQSERSSETHLIYVEYATSILRQMSN
jgi:hypothetical protein